MIDFEFLTPIPRPTLLFIIIIFDIPSFRLLQQQLHQQLMLVHLHLHQQPKKVKVEKRNCPRIN
jgi:hypothetical protein